VGSTGKELLDEAPLLLDPCLDDAEQVLIYQPNGEITARNQRGWTTIDVFALNRGDLVERRRIVAEQSNDLCRKIVRALDREDYLVLPSLLKHGYATNTPFAAVTRQFVNQRVQTRRLQATEAMRLGGLSLEDLVGSLPRVTEKALRYYGGPRSPSDDEFSASESYELENPNRYSSFGAVGARTAGISRVRIENFKGIDQLTLNVASEFGAGSWTMLIGENGVGKTSVLQAVAFALAGPDIAARIGVRPNTFTRQGTLEGCAIVELSGTGDLCSLRFSRRGRMQHDSPYPVAVAGYGATRLPHIASAKKAKYKSGGIENLFDPHASLLSPDRWVPDLDLDKQASVLRSVHTALRLENDEYLYFTNSGNLRLQRGDVRLDLKDLSSGYQAVGALALDLARIFIADWDSLEAAEGLVLLDEIETHLHPRWQMQIVSSLRSAFPRVQFIATTHSPLCLRGLREGEVRVLRTSPAGRIWVDDDLPSVEGLSADQLLMSEYFGLHSTLDAELQRLYGRYYQLLSLRDPIPAQREELQKLKSAMTRYRQYGTTRRERIMYEVIDDFLAHEEEVASKSESDELEESALAELAGIWASLDA
jgi:energy-coupling factor transporter ATP-binding protein EcfA2